MPTVLPHFLHTICFGHNTLLKVVILSGMFIPPLAYAPLARNMAQKGHPSFIVRFDFDLGKSLLVSLALFLARDVAVAVHACKT